MDTSQHSLSTLFEQLGLPSDKTSIEQFIAHHGPILPETLLYQAPFWTDAQASFLENGLKDDSDWAVIIDELDVLLRQ
ncbi:MAG TPA: DUF2789 domain-containing protein [Marinobacter sp.]|nr:DUF2789 domain-containing protein [Marinobacter sp.]